MSVKIMSLVWEHYPVGGGELLTALAYADHAHDDGAGIRPSVAYMARKTRQSERTIQMHVASMKNACWLLTVRNARGGRGRTTEYRINPDWIRNPAGFASFAASVETVQLASEKGEEDRRKGCKAFAPQPSRTVTEPTTTDFAVASAVVAVEDLRWPGVFAGDFRGSAVRLIASCPSAWRQAVLDEVAGLDLRGAVRHPVGLLRKLVEAAVKGDFVPNAGLEVKHGSSEPAAPQERRAREEAERVRRSTPEAREAGRQALREIRARLGLPESPRTAASSSSVAASEGKT